MIEETEFLEFTYTNVLMSIRLSRILKMNFRFQVA
jgi:hypothetical protein